MDYSAQPSLSVGKLGSNRKRKAEDDDHEGRRVRSGAPPPSALAASSAVGIVPSSARLEAGHGEDKRSWEKEDEGYAKEFLQGSGGDGHSSSPFDVGVLPRSTGQWASVKQERHKRQRGALNQFQAFKSSLSPSMHGMPPRHVGYEAFNTPLSPRLGGTPPNYSGYQAMPGVGRAERKRDDGDDLEVGGTGENSRRVCSKAKDAPPSKLQREMGPPVVVFSHSGLRLGQLLPTGEILGFKEFTPLAQLYDLYYLASVKPKAEHAWIHHTWQQIHKSAGVKSPPWQQDYWREEISKSAGTSKDHTFRAIKTFRELSEERWQIPSAEYIHETLNLLLKEMDYTVLLLLVHGHQDDQGVWSNRLKVLFGRLDPALRPNNQLANLTSSGVALEPKPEDSLTKTQPWYLPSDLPAGMEEPLEHVAFFKPWPNPILPSAPGSVSKETHAGEDEPMDIMW